MVMNEKERSRMKAVHMDNLRGLLSIRKIDKGVVGSDGRFDEGVLWWFGHVERMENDRIAKRVYVG